MSFPKGLRTAILAIVLTVASLASIAAVTGGVYRTTTPGSSDPGLVVRTVGANTVTGTVTANGGGTAGSANAGVMSVQGIASMTPVQVGDNSSSLTVDSAQLPAALGQGTMAQSMTVAIASNQSTIPAQPTTSAGTAATRSTTADLGGTVTAVKGSAGTLYGIICTNAQAASNAYLQIFDVAAGSVTLGTTAPSIEILCPQSSLGSGSIIDNFPVGVIFGTAISIASTTTSGGMTGSSSGVRVTILYQ